jgi:uncharacterized protein (TIGR03905 family)
MHYKTKGTCSSAIDLEIENGVITACQFTGGCRGNTNGLARVVVGQNAEHVMNTLRGIPCRGNTSCPDQLSHAIEEYLAQHKAQ